MKITAIAVLALAAAAGSANAGLIAYWRFPETVPASSVNFQIAFPIAADQKTTSGAAQITTNANTFTGTGSADLQGAFQYLTGGPGNINALPGVIAGSELGIRGLTQTNSNSTNNKYIQFQVDTTNFADLVMTYSERATSTGAGFLALSYSTDGVNFTSGSTVTITKDSTYRLQTIDLSTINMLENVPTAYIRMTMSGYTGASGTYRVDNIQFNGTVIPAPGALALVGLGGLLAARRRR